MKHEYVLALDPSGAFQEGKGTTGWVLFSSGAPFRFGAICATFYPSAFDYWDSHIDLIRTLKMQFPDLAVITEDYLLYAQEAKAQINSRFETCQLLGVLKYYCGRQKIPIFTQMAAEVKNRWADTVLVRKGILTRTGKRYLLNGLPTHDHIRDALRHGMHFTTFYNT